MPSRALVLPLFSPLPRRWNSSPFWNIDYFQKRPSHSNNGLLRRVHGSPPYVGRVPTNLVREMRRGQVQGWGC